MFRGEGHDETRTRYPAGAGILRRPFNLGQPGGAGVLPGHRHRIGPSVDGLFLTGIGVAVIYSAFAGFCSALTAGRNDHSLSFGAGLILLAVGIAVQAATWETLPVWFHLVFLASIVPFTYVGAHLYKPKEATTE